MNLSPLATWLASNGAAIFEIGEYFVAPWGITLDLTGLVASMVVNALVTGLIAFKILKVLLKVKPTSVEQTLGSLRSTVGPKLRHILFIIIESGMALFAIQLVRVVATSLDEYPAGSNPKLMSMSLKLQIALDVIIFIHQALNVITRSVHFYFFYFTDNIYLPRELHQQ